MKNQKFDMLGFILAVVTGAYLFASLLLCTFLPRIILPKFNASLLTVLSLAALVIEHYTVCSRRRDFRLVPLFGAFVFGVFPLAAFVTAPFAAVKAAVMGAVLFTVITWLFDMATDRLSSGPVSRLAPVISAFGLFLASQCLMGII